MIKLFRKRAIWSGRLALRLEEVSLFEALVHPRSHMEDRRTERYWPVADLSLEQIEGMFEYGMAMDYSTPFGILHITPDPEHIPKKGDTNLFEERRTNVPNQTI